MPPVGAPCVGCRSPRFRVPVLKHRALVVAAPVITSSKIRNLVVDMKALEGAMMMSRSGLFDDAINADFMFVRW